MAPWQFFGGIFVAKLCHAALEQELEAERLRIREIRSRGTYGSEYFNIVTPEFAQKFDDDALIRASDEYSTHSAEGARRAGDVLRTELRLRQSRDGKVTLRYVRLTFVVAIVGIIATVLAPLVGG